MSNYTGLSQIIERNAQVRGNQPATITNKVIHTWSDVRHHIACVAKFLVDKGIKPDSKIAILAANSATYMESLFVPAWMGAVAVPLNTRWSLKENLYAIKDSDASVLFFDDAFYEIAGLIKEQTIHIVHFIYMGETHCPDWASSYNDLACSGEEIASVTKGGESMAFIMYTGGTIGNPKGVMLSHAGVYSSSIAIAMDVENKSTDIYLHAAPMFHGADFAFSNATSIVGGTHVFLPAFTPAALMEVISTYKVTITLLVPTMIKMLLNDASAKDADLSSLKKLVYGASPMDEGTLNILMNTLPGLQLYQAYGQTELSPLGTISGPENHSKNNRRLRSAGRAGYCIQLRIRKDDGSIAKTGEIGEVEISGPNIMLGYLNQPKLTAETLIGGYVRTGDAGYLDEDGYLFLVDRVKDMIISGGENVFSVEVENIISLHPGVKDVVVIGIPHAEWGEQVHCIIIKHDNNETTEQEIIEHTKGHIAGFKCPKSVTFRSEPFPISGAGKILKVELREPYWAGNAHMIN